MLQISNDHYTPATFYPENGGKIYFSFDVTADPARVPEIITASVEIFDDAGVLVRSFSEELETHGEPLVHAAFEWDATDTSGNPVPYGRYAPTITAVADDDPSFPSCSGISILSLSTRLFENRKAKTGVACTYALTQAYGDLNGVSTFGDSEGSASSDDECDSRPKPKDSDWGGFEDLRCKGAIAVNDPGLGSDFMGPSIFTMNSFTFIGAPMGTPVGSMRGFQDIMSHGGYMGPDSPLLKIYGPLGMDSALGRIYGPLLGSPRRATFR